VIRKILALAAVGALAFSAVAWAVTSGKYSGKSELPIAGTHVSHPLSVTVRHNTVVGLSFLAGSNCADLVETAGIKTHLPINSHKHFGGTLKISRSRLKIQGTFKGRTVTGSFTGTARGLTLGCSIPKNTFKATLPG
jgi:hypothetical protein